MLNLHVDENITLRLMTTSDAPDLLTLFEQNRDHLTEWQDWPNKIQTLDDCTQYIERHEREYDEGKTVGCVILFQEQVVGMCTLTKIVPFLRKAFLSYWIAEDYQGKGIVTKASKALLQHAFETMKLNRIALTYKQISDINSNVRSRRTAERLGFKQEGILRQDGMTKGVFMDMVICSLLANEWQIMQK